ncbi:VanZ family protein [Kitasatospora sp. GP82]|uniref:VanZ family protein n=1 Tax=Kitasatospora sp. GP82 TaxID=3035089 RepID=UPI002475B022|nr:VanZ family protein [Kitasatospora sp. GP82]
MQRDGTTTRHERGTGVQAGGGPTDRVYAPPPAPDSSQSALSRPPEDGRPEEPPPPEPLPEVSLPVRRLGLSLLTAYLVIAGWFILRPLAVGWTAPANLTPFASVDQAMAIGGLAGARQLAAGLLPLAPLGILLPLAGGRLRIGWLPSFLHTVGGSALLATALEILKGWTPGHVLDVDNILLGTLGVAATHLTFVPAGRTRLRTRATAAPVPRAPAPPAPSLAEPDPAPAPAGHVPAPVAPAAKPYSLAAAPAEPR